MKSAVFALAASLYLVCGWSASAQNKIALVYRAKAGQAMRYKADGSLTMEAAGQKLTLELKQTEKVTVVAVAPNGDVTHESRTESSETVVNGQKMPDEERNEATTTVVRPNRTLVSYKRDSAEPDPTKLSVRLYCATTPVFPTQPVGPGDKWSHDYKADDDVGIRSARADLEALAFEQVGSTATLKVRMVYRETEGAPALTATTTAWIERSTGDTVRAETDVENVPFGEGPTASGKLSEERVEGNPLGETSTATTGGAGGAKPETKPEPKKEKTIDEIVKDYEKLPGLFTAYRKKESGRETIYLEVREDQLNQLMMLEVTASTGTSDHVVAGTPINDIVFRFERVDERLLMVVPNYRFRASEKTPIARAVKRSFADAYLESFKIEAKQEERKSLLINVSDLFRGDIAEISALFSGGGALPGLAAASATSYAMDREKTLLMSLKLFPENLVAETQYHFTRSGTPRGAAAIIAAANSPLADHRSIPLRVVYTLFRLTDDGYRPRLADPRVGYFLTDYQDFTKDSVDDDKVRLIYRWNLEKTDPAAAVSAPKKPIVFWLDNAIPTEYRDAVRQGILAWNKAFEKAGFRNAIEVKQMPDDADWDHADMRYNCIRWVTSPSDGYAVSLFRVNPLTGQILNASITVDANVLRFTKLERRRIVAPAAHFDDIPGEPVREDRHVLCSFAQGAMEQAWFGHLALSLVSPLDATLTEKAFAEGFIRSIVTHEMGHILGLRHNFVSSTAFNLAQLADAALVKREGVTASVMDYTPFNLSALKRPGVPYWSSSVGRYDIWAIQYGYSPIKASTTEGEMPTLRQIASRCTETGLAYQSDEIADQFDPEVTRFDLGSDPLAYWTRNLQVMRYLLLNLDQRTPKKGESYYQFTQQLSMLMGLYARAASTVSRYVGGIKVRGNHRGDPHERPTLEPIGADKQREALRLLGTYVFAPKALSLPSSYYTRLAGDPFPNLVETVLSGATSDYPLRDTISGIQVAALRRLLSPAVLKRVANNEFKAAGSPTFTLAELYSTLYHQVWSDLTPGQSVNALRRLLQRAHVDILTSMVVSPPAGLPDDARMLAWGQLRSLRARLVSARRPRSADPYTPIHIEELLARIQRALDAKQTISAPTPPTQNLLQMLLGGARPTPSAP